MKLEAWAPLGQGNAGLLSEPVITELAKKYNKNAGQVIFDFELTEDEMNEIRALDKGHGRHNPDAPGIGEMLLKAYDVHKNE